MAARRCRRAGMIGSLILGAYDEQGRLVHIGQVGTGFTTEELRRIARQLHPLERESSPFGVAPPRAHVRHARWVEPVLVGEVLYRTLTPDHRLRHPTWRGLRPDRNASEFRRENLR